MLLPFELSCFVIVTKNAVNGRPEIQVGLRYFFALIFHIRHELLVELVARSGRVFPLLALTPKLLGVELTTIMASHNIKSVVVKSVYGTTFIQRNFI